MKKRLLTALIIFIAVVGMFFWVRRDMLPKDPIARYMVQENAGKIRFEGKSDMYIGGVIYHFVLTDYDDPELLGTIIQTFKNAIRQCAPDTRWAYHGFCLWESYANPDVKSSVISISDYNYDEHQIYDDFQHIEISGLLTESPEVIYNHAETYLQIKDVRKLVVTPKIDKDARENGINWYEIWPELESYEVKEMDTVSEVRHSKEEKLVILSIIIVVTGIIFWIKRNKLPQKPLV